MFNQLKKLILYMFYFVKTPWLISGAFKHYIWSIDTKEKEIFLTFDDGPHPEITDFVLTQLKYYNAHATFFCVAKNVKSFPDMYTRILDEGHGVGNHTYNHLNGWKVKDKTYLNDISEANNYIDSKLFRPPYGKLSKFQAQQIAVFGFHIVMWTVLSGDFDKKINAEKCRDNVILNAKEGSIVVFHDSEKAFPRLKYALPEVLKFFSEKGYTFKALK